MKNNKLSLATILEKSYTATNISLELFLIEETFSPASRIDLKVWHGVATIINLPLMVSLLPVCIALDTAKLTYKSCKFIVDKLTPVHKPSQLI